MRRKSALVTELEARLNESRDRNKELSRDIEGLNSIITSRETEIAFLNRKINDVLPILESDKSNTEDKIKVLFQELERTMHILNSKTDECESLKRDILILRDEANREDNQKINYL